MLIFPDDMHASTDFKIKELLFDSNGLSQNIFNESVVVSPKREGIFDRKYAEDQFLNIIVDDGQKILLYKIYLLKSRIAHLLF